VQRQQEEIVSGTGEAERRRRPANGTINREVAILLRMLRLGLEHGKVARVPIVQKPKEAPPRSGFFEPEAFAPCAPAAGRSPGGGDDRLYVRVADAG
jgi:hypothetical protein